MRKKARKDLIRLQILGKLSLNMIPIYFVFLKLTRSALFILYLSLTLYLSLFLSLPFSISPSLSLISLSIYLFHSLSLTHTHSLSLSLSLSPSLYPSLSQQWIYEKYERRRASRADALQAAYLWCMQEHYAWIISRALDCLHQSSHLRYPIGHSTLQMQTTFRGQATHPASHSTWDTI